MSCSSDPILVPDYWGTETDPVGAEVYEKMGLERFDWGRRDLSPGSLTIKISVICAVYARS